MAYYQQNSLGSSFPGVDTTLRYPYKDVAEVGSVVDRQRHAVPVQNSEPPIPAGESWAEVLFTFVAEFPDELTIEVSSGCGWFCLATHWSPPCAQKHDWVRVVSKDTNKLGWWQGECHGRVRVCHCTVCTC